MPIFPARTAQVHGDQKLDNQMNPALQHHPQLATAITVAQGPTNNQKHIKIM